MPKYSPETNLIVGCLVGWLFGRLVWFLPVANLARATSIGQGYAAALAAIMLLLQPKEQPRSPLAFAFVCCLCSFLRGKS